MAPLPAFRSRRGSATLELVGYVEKVMPTHSLPLHSGRYADLTAHRFARDPEKTKLIKTTQRTI